MNPTHPHTGPDTGPGTGADQGLGRGPATRVRADQVRPGTLAADRVRADRVRTTALLLGLVALSFTPLAPLTYLLIPAAVAATATYLVWRRDFIAAIELTLWCWLLAAFVRRVIEVHTGYHEQNLILLTPALATLPLAAATIAVRTTLPRNVLAGIAGITAAMTLGLTMAATQITPVALIAGATDWLPPLALGTATLLLPLTRHALATTTAHIGIYGGLIVGTYGIIQWLIVPTWDATWLNNVAGLISASASFGQPIPQQIRVFSTLNSAGPAAVTLLFLIVAASISRGPLLLKTLSIGTAITAIGLTEVRQVYIAGALYLLLALARGIYPLAPTLAATTAIVLLILTIPALTDSIGTRITQSAQAGSGDTSLTERIAFQRTQFGPALTRPVGLGIGSTGAGVRADGSGDSSRFSYVDSGYLELVRSFGAFLTVVFLGSIVLVLRRVPRARHDRSAQALFLLTLTLPLQLLLGNAFTGLVGAMTWFPLFLAVRLALQSDSARRREPVTRVRAA